MIGRLVVFVFLLAVPASAAVTLPWSTTFNCTAITQSDVGWPGCDGMSSYGGWTSGNGGKEEITASANYSGGGGGKGQRHEISNGTNSNSGSLVTNFNNPSTEIYVRWYFRFQAGLQVSSNTSPHKMLYWNDCTGNGGGCYFAMGPNVVRMTVAGTNYDNGSTWGFNDLMGGSTSDGQWHWVELHVKRVSGSGNDIAEAWFDGVQRLNRTNVTFNGTTAGFDGAIIPENGAFVTSPTNQDNYEDIDDIAIQTTGPIGALGGGGSSSGSHPSGGVKMAPMLNLRRGS